MKCPRCDKEDFSVVEISEDYHLLECEHCGKQVNPPEEEIERVE